MRISIAPTLLFLLLPSLAAAADRHEVGLLLGHIFEQNRSGALGAVKLNSGLALQANYGYRLFERGEGLGYALFVDVPFLANGQRLVSSPDRRAASDIASLYITPGLRLKFLPKSRVQPYVAGGFGYGQTHASELLQDGSRNPGRDRYHSWAASWGGGVDVRVWRQFGLRTELRDYYHPNPRLNTPLNAANQHNIVWSYGFTLNFR